MNIVRSLLARCDQGFTLPQKVGLTIALLLYWAMPLDLIPDVLIGLGQLDDAFFTYAVFRVWRSPTR